LTKYEILTTTQKFKIVPYHQKVSSTNKSFALSFFYVLLYVIKATLEQI